MFVDFARYYVIAKSQGNQEALVLIRDVMLWLLGAVEQEGE